MDFCLNRRNSIFSISYLIIKAIETFLHILIFASIVSVKNVQGIHLSG